MSNLESQPPPLPRKFKNIQEVRITNPGSIISLIGFAKDFQPAIATSREDWKSSLEIVDPSIQYENQESCIKLHFFAALDRQLENIGTSDLVVLRDAKVQNKEHVVSLLSNWNTQVHVLKASEIPHDLSIYAPGPSKKGLPWLSKSPGKNSSNAPTATEMSYALWGWGEASKMNFPSNFEFQEKTIQATNMKDKFGLLKDVKPNGYYNFIGQVLKLFDTSRGWVEIQFSDYTSNKHFYEHIQDEDSSKGEDEVTDEYGYGNKFPKDQKNKSWRGPFGKFTIQVTLFDENASHAMDVVKVDDWVYLKNVRIVERDFGLLEGKLHGQRGNEGKVLMGVLDPESSTDGRLKEATKRRSDYWESFRRKQARQSKTAAGEKRKFGEDGSEKFNSKQRRMEARATGIRKGEEQDSKAKQALDLNTNVRCSYPQLPIVPLAEIMKPEKLAQAGGGEDIFSPFTLRKYRANVRVIDFAPHRIEDFTTSQPVSENDILPDWSDTEDIEGEDDRPVAKHNIGATRVVWEWSFALQVEDVEAMGENSRLWLLVNNQAAQGLLGLDSNATDLRGNPDLVYQLKEKLFILWGDLHDTIAALPDIDGAPPSTLENLSLTSSPVRIAGDQPDADDSDDGLESSVGPDPQIIVDQADTNLALIDRSTKPKSVAKNKPFTCCIQQYGVNFREADPLKANAGKGQKWQRVFGIFGTTIV